MLKSKRVICWLYQIWILCCACYCQSCLPPSPTYTLESHTHHPTLSHFNGGFQALLPHYTFNCSGRLQEVLIQAVGEAQFELQTWRPVGHGLFRKVWGELYYPYSTTDKAFTRLNKDTLEWTALKGNGIPVRGGDVFGFYVKETKGPFQLLHSSDASSAVYYVNNTDASLCDMSLCDSSVLPNTAPLITATGFSPTTKIALAASNLSLKPPSCTPVDVKSCLSKRVRFARQEPSTSTAPSNISTTPSAVTLPPMPTPKSNTTTVKPTRPGLVVKVSPEAVGFIVVGIILLVILVVLVFVLIACLRTKGMRVEQSSSLLSKSSRVPDGESVVTNSTHLAGSTSGEHSVSSNDPTSSRIPHRSTSMHHYINGEISQRGVFSSFSPKYVNTRDSPLSQTTSHEHLRSDRVWSTSAIQNGRVFSHGVKAPFRAKSVEPSARLCIGIQAPPVPPRGQTRSKGQSSSGASSQIQSSNSPSTSHLSPHDNTTHRYSVLEVSGDYADPIPPEERQRAQSCAAWVGNTVRDRDRFSHEYAEPDSPSMGETQMEGGQKYDKLSPKDGSPRSEMVGVALGPKGRWSYVGSEDHSYSDPDKLSNTNSLERSLNCSYVPTENQRRLIVSGNHYEMQDDFEQERAVAYDHLRFFEERETYWSPATTESGLYTQLYENKYRELPRNEIKVIKQIGSGHFGTVSMGVWENEVNSEPVEVAIKTVRSSDEIERIKLLQEAAIMGQFAHCNVVRLMGVVTVGDPALVILEYMTRGDLRSFLQKLHPRVSKRELPDVLPCLFVKFSKDIANGMSYLSKKNFVHRDLAARNILLTNDLTCKIGDFGMARDVENDYYKSHGGIIPVKWTAPEALNYNKFSSASDVWSYGMVLYEIWSLGEKPFNDLTNPIVIALVSSKHCQAPPPGCPRAVYHLMVECWNPDASKRPTFDSIFGYLDSPIESLNSWHSSDIIPDRRAHILGAPLRESNNLYLELQRTYQKPLIGNCD